jgi:two-component system chemotaxis sensor kinase CheA
VGDRIQIDVEDDGAGIDPAELRRVAVERGMLSADEASQLTEEEALGLMFRPGFSTRRAVSATAGRGVGMDVVKSRIDAMTGDIQVRTKLGSGTCFTLSVPVSVAAVRALLVCSGEQTYAIPAGGVAGVEWAEGDRARGARSLSALLGGNARDHGSAVLLRHGDSESMLLVDEVVGEAMIVTEPLGPLLAGLTTITGAAILADGTVAPVLALPFLLWGEPVPAR